MMKVYYVNLTRMKLVAVFMEPVDREIRLFSSKEKAETWLIKNGFVYGQRRFFSYPSDGREWFHRDDICADYVDVEIIEMDMDDLTESKFKYLNELHREWLPSFLKN